MPVLGHALAGWVAAAWTLRLDHLAPADQTRAAFRLPALITISYLPDLAGQVGSAFGWYRAGAYTHSLGFALAASALTPLIAWTGLGQRRAWLLTVTLVILHDVMDLMQAGNRLFLWPFYGRVVGPAAPLFPSNLAGETVLFGLVALVALFSNGVRVPRRAEQWLAAVLVSSILTGAFATHVLRDRRERQMSLAKALVAGRDYRTAIASLDQAGRWPSTARPGRVDYLLGESYLGLGDRARAERHYLRALALDPDYFWVVADLAVFYADAALPRTERERLMAPYVDRLSRDFAAETELPRILARIDRKLLENP